MDAYNIREESAYNASPIIDSLVEYVLSKDVVIIKVEIVINALIAISLSMEHVTFVIACNGKTIDVLFVKVDFT